MNRSTERTNRQRTSSRFTRFVCPALRFIAHEFRKRHSFLNKFSMGDNISNMEFEIRTNIARVTSTYLIGDVIRCDSLWYVIDK